jgi:hypothetical protein
MDEQRATPDPAVAAEIAHQAAEHERFAFDDASYLLGGLSEPERIAYEQHLEHCPLCQSELADLADLPKLLERADPAAWTAEQPPDTLLPRLLREVHRERRHRFVRGGLVGLAAACLVALLTVVGATVWRADHSPQTLALRSVAGDVPVDATVTLKESKSGTSIKLKCSYHSNQPYDPNAGNGKPMWYQMVVVNRSGQKSSLSSWPAPKPGEDVLVDKMTHWPKGDIAAILVTKADGAAVLRVDL